MKKLLCLLVALTLVFALVGCADFNSTVTDYSGNVSSNGGFAVVKGDYVYLINGYDLETADNTFGKVVHGGIVRIKTADLGKDDIAAEMVVPKLVHTEYTGSGSGLFIAGDYVYYPTVNDQKSSSGTVKYSEEVFMKTKLDASESKIITTVSSHDVPYRFYEMAGRVFLTVYLTETDDDGNDVNYLVTYDENGKEVKRSEKVVSYDLGEFGSDYAYYVRTAYNETLEQDESFNEVHRYSLDGSNDVMVLNGVGGYTDKVNGIGTQGVTFTIVKNAPSALFVAMTYVDTSVASSTVYYALDHTGINTAGDAAGAKANYDAMTLLNDGDNNASTIFAADAVYVAKNCIIYTDANYGIVKYDYTERNGLREGFTYIFQNKDIMGYTYEYKEGNYLYYSDSSSYYYRLDLSELVNMTTGETIEGSEPTVQRLTYCTTYTPGEWFNPEYVGDYMLYLRDGEPYDDYVYYVGLKDIEVRYEKSIVDITDDEIEDYEEELDTIEERADIEAKLKKRVGILSDVDKDALATYLDNNYPED